MRVFTIGHSTRSIDELVELLRSFGIVLLVDVRSVPGSRRNPQFHREALAQAMRAHGIGYVHLGRLGGLRKTHAGSPNGAWRNASFRGYADYMQTEEFERGLAELRDLFPKGPLAVMCAEAVPWRCHRSLIADALVVRGIEVEHVTAAGRSHPHRLTPFARVEGERVTYPAPEDGGDAGDSAASHARDAPGEPLETRAPFHLQATVRVLQRRPTNPVDVWEDGRYVRALATPAGPVVITVVDRGTVARPDLRLLTSAGEPTAAVRAPVRRILGLDVDPRPLARVARADPALGKVARALRGMRPPRFPDLFETFASVIPFQQVSLASGVATLARVVERFGTTVEHDGRVRRVFPTAASIAAAGASALRACGLSARRADALRAAARAIVSGEASEQRLASLDTRAALAALNALPGIGPWSAALILLRGLGRLDALPPNDSGLARALAEITGLDPATAKTRLEQAGLHRGYLYFCTLGARQLAQGLIDTAVDTVPHTARNSSARK